MKYLTGSASEANADQLIALGVGLLATPRRGSPEFIARFSTWAADNECFTLGAKFDAPRWLDWLDGDLPQASCAFAAIPDVVGDYRATLDRFNLYADRVMDLGYPVALVSQDGLKSPDVPWEHIDALFTGGTDAWKLNEPAYALIREATERGLHTHMGRVNSFKRLAAAANAGYDTADGTFLKFAPDHNVPRMAKWLRRLDHQPALPLTHQGAE